MKNQKKLLWPPTLLLIALALAPQTVLAQTKKLGTEKLGIVSYTPPKGWNKTVKPNVVAFNDSIQATGGFCIITLYGATPGGGNPNQEFAREWANLVVKVLKVEANPTKETQAVGGWTMTAGASSVAVAGGKSLVLLTVFSGFGKTVSVLGVFNDQSYMTQLEAFVDGLAFDDIAQVASPGSVAPAANQSDHVGKFGSLTYTAPAGWTEQIFQDGVLLTPADLPADEQLTVRILPPLMGGGSLEQALAQSYGEVAAMHKATLMNFAGGATYTKNAAQKSFRGWSYIRGKGAVQVENGTPYATELGLELFVVKVDNRFERVSILESRKTCNLSRYYASDRTSYRNSLEALLFSLQFPEFPTPTLTTGSAKGTGIVGVWQGVSLSVGATSIGQPLGVRYKVYSPIFLTNGQAYFGPNFPDEGLAGIDTRVLHELHSRDWGTYTFSNGQGVLKMLYGDIPLRMENGKLIITANKTDHGFIKMNVVDGARFNGTYVLSELNGQVPAITFTAAGRFTDNGALKVLAHEPIECLNPAATPGSGTYQVKDYSVIFQYADGRKLSLAFLGAGYNKENPSPAILSLSSNEDEMKKQ